MRAEVREVIVVHHCIGKGVKADPYREETLVLEKDGTMLAFLDPLPAILERRKKAGVVDHVKESS